MSSVSPASDNSAPVRRSVIRRVPLADQVEALLTHRLRSGEIRPGDQLPSEHDLATELDVSRATVRIALGSLTKRGLVIGRQGVGNFASQATRMENDLTEALDLNDLIARSGRRPAVIFDSAKVVAAPVEVATALRLGTPSPHRTTPDQSDLVLQCHKRFTANGDTVILVINSLPARLLGRETLSQLATAPGVTEPLFPFLAGRGLATSFQTSTITACRGDQVAYPDHGLDAAEAILEMVEVGYTDDNEPCWHSHSWYAPDAMTFQMVRRPPSR